MIRDRIASWTRAVFPLLLAGAIVSCSGEDIVFPGDDDDDDDATVTFTGTLDDVSPVTTRDIVVFVFSVDDANCPCPTFPGDMSEGKAAVIESGDTEFTVSGIENGAVKIVFLLDNPGDEADGTIDDGDLIAVLDDEDCEIDDVDGDLTVTLHDIDIEFAANPAVDCEAGDPPAAGRARADLITQERTDDNDNGNDDDED